MIFRKLYDEGSLDVPAQLLEAFVEGEGSYPEDVLLTGYFIN